MSQDEWQEAGERSGVRDASLHIGEELDESKLMEILGDSLPNFSPPIDETEAQRVDEWASHSRRPLTGQAKNMLINLLRDCPEADETMFTSALYGWDARGEQDVIEAKNVLRATLELLNTHLTSQCKKILREKSQVYSLGSRKL